jgi:hypothetical protein
MWKRIKAARSAISTPPSTSMVLIRDMQDGGEILSDIRAWDAHGRLCYLIEGFRAQATPALNRLGGGWSGGLRSPDDAVSLDAAE